MEKIIIIGGGGLGKIVIDILVSDARFEIEGVIDPSLSVDKVNGIKVIGPDSELPDILKSGIRKAVLAIGGVSLETNIGRIDKYSRIEKMGFEMVNCIQKGSYISPTAKIGKGNIMIGSCYIGPNVKIGSGIIMHPFTSVEHDSILEDYLQLSQGVKVAGGARIGRASFIGMGANIIQGAVVPEKTFVKSNSNYQ